MQQAKTCCICTTSSHTTNMCPILQDDLNEQANTVGGFTGSQRQRYDPYSNTYNPGWKEHPNFSYVAKPFGF